MLYVVSLDRRDHGEHLSTKICPITRLFRFFKETISHLDKYFYNFYIHALLTKTLKYRQKKPKNQNSYTEADLADPARALVALAAAAPGDALRAVHDKFCAFFY
jgi:hypothetical protein